MLTREIQDARAEGRVSLRPGAACTHETGEDMYLSYGWSISSDIFGRCDLQTVEYGWLDAGLSDQYVILTPAGNPLEGKTYCSRKALLAAARAVWPAAKIDGDYLYAASEEVAEVEFLPADPVQRTILALGWPDSGDSDHEIKSERKAIADDLVDRARSVREDMDSVSRLLDDAVAAYQRSDLTGVIAALEEASSIETEHGDDPATSELMRDLLQVTEAEE